MWKFWLSFFLIVLAVPLIPFALFGELPGESWVEHPDPWVVFLIGVAVLAGDILLPIPASLIAVFLGARLGWAAGGLAIFVGLSLGCALGYALGWFLGHPLLRRWVSPRQRAVLGRLDGAFSYLTLALVRAVPLLSEASVLAAGVARLQPLKVTVTLAAANLGLALLYAGFGSIGQQTTSGATLLLGGIGVPVLSVLLVYSLMRWAQRKHP